MKIHYPTLYSEIKEYIAVGRFIPVGGTWVEMVRWIFTLFLTCSNSSNYFSMGISNTCKKLSQVNNSDLIYHGKISDQIIQCRSLSSFSFVKFSFYLLVFPIFIWNPWHNLYFSGWFDTEWWSIRATIFVRSKVFQKGIWKILHRGKLNFNILMVTLPSLLLRINSGDFWNSIYL